MSNVVVNLPVLDTVLPQDLVFVSSEGVDCAITVEHLLATTTQSLNAFATDQVNQAFLNVSNGISAGLNLSNEFQVDSNQ